MSFGLSRGKELDSGEYGYVTADLPPHDSGPFDPRDWFGHPDRRFELEIGSGKGTFLVQQSVLEPETNFLGIEWAGEFCRYAADRIRRHEMKNVRMLHTDATEFIRYWCPDGIADVIHLYFSDPWPKSRHHKRRVLRTRPFSSFTDCSWMVASFALSPIMPNSGRGTKTTRRVMNRSSTDRNSFDRNQRAHPRSSGPTSSASSRAKVVRSTR